jgi:hypothetical protein
VRAFFYYLIADIILFEVGSNGFVAKRDTRAVSDLLHAMFWICAYISKET